MSQSLTLKAKGLYTHPNPLGGAPDGGLLVADNVVIDKEEIVETRRGFKKYGIALANTPKALFNYQDRLLVHHGSKLAYDSDAAGTWIDFAGTYDPPTDALRIQSVEANRNLYFTTSAGIKKLTSYNGAVESAGGIKAIDGSGVTSGASGWMANNNQVAYRIVWGLTDANNNKILGAPSQRIIVTNNSGGTRNVDLTFSIPDGITTSHVYQIYRSAISGGVSTEPNDELQLVVEKSPTAGEIAAKSVTYTDQTPDSLRGATIYTAPSQQGIAQANEPPPLANDITYYKNLVLYANTVSKHRLTMTIISIGGSVGLVNDDTVTIAGVVYTGKGAENVAAAQFLVSTGGTASQNIDATARSLVKVINGYSGNTLVYAYYLSGYQDLPGQILIEERGFGGSAFVAISSRGGAFSPTIPSSGTSYTSTNDTARNKIFISKILQPESVPLLNYVEVGSANQAILRVIALRDSCFVLKEDGIYRITGEQFSDLRVSLFDGTTTLKGLMTAVPFNNRITCFTDQTIAAISDSGVAIISRPIEFTLFRLSSNQFASFQDVSVGIAYESDRKYILSTVAQTTDTRCVQQFVYNSVTNSWTRWDRAIACGIVSEADNKFYYGSSDPAVKYIFQERKDFTTTDYADDETDVTIVGYTGTTVQVVSSAAAVVGDSLVQFVGATPARASVITSIPDATHIVVATPYTWTPGAAKIMTRINEAVQWLPAHGGNPTMVKKFTVAKMVISNAIFRTMRAFFSTDFSPNDETVDLTPAIEGPWGEFPWGSAAWGGDNVNPQNVRTLFHPDKAQGHWINLKLTHGQALTAFSLLGVAVFFEEQSERMR